MDDIQRTNWNEAKAGFELMRPWIKDQFQIDGDTVQIMEILLDVVNATLPWRAEISSQSTTDETHDNFEFSLEFRFVCGYKTPEQKRELEDLAIKELGPHHDAFIEWTGINTLFIFWNGVQL